MAVAASGNPSVTAAAAPPASRRRRVDRSGEMESGSFMVDRLRGSDGLLDDGNPVGRPAPVETEGHTNRQTDRRNRLTGKVLRLEDYDVAQVAFRVVDVRQDPAFI